jgi:hypothetical protein
MDRDAMKGKLLAVLLSVGFSDKYYNQFVESKSRAHNTRVTVSEISAAIASLPATFRYNKREDFFRHSEREGSGEIGLNLAFPYQSTIEAILVVKTAAGDHIGGPFTLLAREARRLLVPDFEFAPRAPKINISTNATLLESLARLFDLYLQARQAILSSDLHLDLAGDPRSRQRSSDSA